MPQPSQEAIQTVIQATECRETQARLYLKRTGNDIEKAIDLLKSHRKGGKSATAASTPHLVDPAKPNTNNALPIHTSDGGDQSIVLDEDTPFDHRTPHWKHLLPEIPQPPESNSSGLATPTTTERPTEGEDTNTSSPTNPGLEMGSNSTAEPVPMQQTDAGEGTARMTYDRDRLDSSMWDFCLPNLSLSESLQRVGINSSPDFSIQDLVAAIQCGASSYEVKRYLHRFQDTDYQIIRGHINDDINGFPAMFYVVGANNESILRLFEKFGGDVNATYGSPPIPLVAFAIINSKIIERDTSDCIATLLSLGAEADVVPGPFYEPFDQNLPGDGPSDEDLEESWKIKGTIWCKPPEMRKLLAETLNITQRYHLHRSSTLVKPTARQKQVAKAKNALDLFAVPYFLVGQSAATELLTKHFLHYMLRNHQQPLVLVFAGPSGHGKTELARRLGSLLSLELHVSDCTIVSRENELFGPRKPYVGAEEGTPLNNFLAAKSGQRCIAFLDEFEKTTQDIWNALLIPFDKGEYQDRRNLRMIDCSKTVWILATNALDKKIVSFCKSNEAILEESHDVHRQDLLEQLTSDMRNAFMEVFRPPLTGRISAFVPFLPFSQPEQCVGAHKYLVELTSDVRRPINMKTGPDEQFIGNIRLKIRADASVCKILTKDYDSDLGIRSLKKAVRDRVAKTLDSEYLAADKKISEDLPIEDYIVFASDGKIKVQRSSI